MSFILDALKKAEAERQRQTGPTLLEVRVSAPRRRFPVWMLVIGGLLGINVVLLAVFLLHRPAAEPAPTAAAAPPVPAVAAVTAAPAAQAPAAVPAVPAAVVGAPGYVPVPYGYAPAGAPQAYPQQPYPQQAYPQPAYPQQSYPQQPYAGAPYPSQPYVAQSPGGDNPADYEPAVTPAPAPRPRASEPKPEPPSLSQIDGNLPELRLDMHVYASRPADRYALINMHRVREGDTLPEGPRVVSIDRDGVELNYRGTEFMLHPQ